MIVPPQHNRRGSARFDVRTRLTFRGANDGMVSALTQNMSFYGVEILSPRLLETKQQVPCWLYDHKSERMVQLTAVVRWVEIEDRYGDSPYWLRLGLAWHRLNMGQRRALESLLPTTSEFVDHYRRQHVLSFLP